MFLLKYYFIVFDLLKLLLSYSVTSGIHNCSCYKYIVETLLRLLLLALASFCSAEISLSPLLRLKTWLRSTIRQDRSFNFMVAHIRKDMLQELSCQETSERFIQKMITNFCVFDAFN